MPLVSIIVPAWNASRFVAETIKSVQDQTFGDWEMLIADDCSADDTYDLVSSFAQSDARIRPLRSPRNQGPALCRQMCIDGAAGRYLAFLDSDDLWLPAKLERQIAHMQGCNSALSYTSFRRMNEDGTRVGDVMRIPESLTYRQLLSNTAIATLTAMVDRQIAGDVRIPNVGYDDFALWLSILRKGHVATGLREDLARYRVRDQSVSSRPLRSIGWVWNIYRNVEKLPLHRSALCLAGYGSRAVLKRIVGRA